MSCAPCPSPLQALADGPAAKTRLTELFQICGRAELGFLTNSGLWFGYLLGVLQMVLWMFWDNPWTLTVGGAVVGYLTNFMALKCIFEPVEPMQVGPFTIQVLHARNERSVRIEHKHKREHDSKAREEIARILLSAFLDLNTVKQLCKLCVMTRLWRC